MSASGVGILNNLSDLSNAYFYFADGEVTAGLLAAGGQFTTHKTIDARAQDSDYDQGALYDRSGLLDKLGFDNHPPTGHWLSPKVLGIACAEQAPADSRPSAGQPACAAPINIGSGNMYEWEQDYSTVGQNPLFFTRYYNSMAVPDTYAVALGGNWRHNFDRYLHIINPSAIYGAIAERETGQYVSFSSSSGTYTTDTDLDYSLSKSGRTWTLTAPDDTVETYSQSGAEATLSSIKLRNGYTQTMHYTSGQAFVRFGHLRPHHRPVLYRPAS